MERQIVLVANVSVSSATVPSMESVWTNVRPRPQVPAKSWVVHLLVDQLIASMESVSVRQAHALTTVNIVVHTRASQTLEEHASGSLAAPRVVRLSVMRESACVKKLTAQRREPV